MHGTEYSYISVRVGDSTVHIIGLPRIIPVCVCGCVGRQRIGVNNRTSGQPSETKTTNDRERSVGQELSASLESEGVEKSESLNEAIHAASTGKVSSNEIKEDSVDYD